MSAESSTVGTVGRTSKTLAAVHSMLVSARITKEEAEALTRIYNDLEPVRNGQVPGTEFNTAFWAAVETTFGTSRGAEIRPMIQQTIIERNNEEKARKQQQHQHLMQHQQQPVAFMGVNVHHGQGGGQGITTDHQQVSYHQQQQHPPSSQLIIPVSNQTHRN